MKIITEYFLPGSLKIFLYFLAINETLAQIISLLSRDQYFYMVNIKLVFYLKFSESHNNVSLLIHFFDRHKTNQKKLIWEDNKGWEELERYI